MKARRINAQRAIYLIRGHVVKTMRLRFASCKPVFARGLKQRMCAHYIGFNKRIRPGDRAVYMTLSSKMHQGIDSVLAQRLQHAIIVADVSVDKTEAFILPQPSKVGLIAGIGEGVIGHHAVLGMIAHPVVDKVSPDESGGPRYQERFTHFVAPYSLRASPAIVDASGRLPGRNLASCRSYPARCKQGGTPA